MRNLDESRVHNAADIRWQDYEELVKDIYQALGQANGVTIECWGSSCQVEGPPGVFHQVDVLTNHSDGIHQYRTAISCKNWNARVGLPVVRDFAQIVQEANLNKGIIVSKMGFTRPAKSFAESKNIGLVELRKPVDKDWDGYIREIRIELTIDQTQVYGLRFDLTVPPPRPGEGVFEGGPVDWPLTLNQIFITSPEGEAETLQKLTDEEQGDHPGEDEHHLRLPEGSVVTIPEHPEHPAHEHSIRGVSFKVRHSPPITEAKVIRSDDHIYMIMESLFDGRRFTITKDREIKESTPSLGADEPSPK